MPYKTRNNTYWQCKVTHHVCTFEQEIQLVGTASVLFDLINVTAKNVHIMYYLR